MEEAGHEPYTFDGVLIKACASHKRFVPRDGSDKPPEKTRAWISVARRANDSHAPTTDPALLKVTSRGRCLGHVLRENRNGRLVDGETTQARGTADFVQAIREAKLKPLVAAKKSALTIDGRTTRPAG